MQPSKEEIILLNGISKTVEGRCSKMQQEVAGCQVEKFDQVKTLQNLRLNMQEIKAQFFYEPMNGTLAEVHTTKKRQK